MQLNELTKKLFDITAKYGKDITIDAEQCLNCLII